MFYKIYLADAGHTQDHFKLDLAPTPAVRGHIQILLKCVRQQYDYTTSSDRVWSQTCWIYTSSSGCGVLLPLQTLQDFTPILFLLFCLSCETQHEPGQPADDPWSFSIFVFPLESRLITLVSLSVELLRQTAGVWSPVLDESPRACVCAPRIMLLKNQFKLFSWLWSTTFLKLVDVDNCLRSLLWLWLTLMICLKWDCS